MTGGGKSEQEKQLDQTPTWAVASICAIIIIISIALEKALHHVGEVIPFLLFRFLFLFYDMGKNSGSSSSKDWGLVCVYVMSL